MDTPVTDKKPIQPQHSTEAPCSANVRARIGGYDWQITCRSHVDQDDLINMARSIKWWNTWLDGNKAQSPAVASEMINIETPHATATVAPTAPPAPVPNGNGNGNGNSAMLSLRTAKMTVTPRADGKVDLKFFEAGHKYPDLYATKTPSEAVTMLKTTGAWTPQHFAAAGEFQINMVIDYKHSENLNKNGKPYKDIVTVSAAA